MEQYRAGERFVDDVVAMKGHVFAHRVWDRPENLPTMDEIRNPATWIDRIEAKDTWAPATLAGSAVTSGS
jgi:uncharacterized protein (DUF2342 family)